MVFFTRDKTPIEYCSNFPLTSFWATCYLVGKCYISLHCDNWFAVKFIMEFVIGQRNKNGTTVKDVLRVVVNDNMLIDLNHVSMVFIVNDVTIMYLFFVKFKPL